MSGEIILNPPTTEINKFISPKAVVVYNENNNEIFRIENCNEIDKTTKSVSDSSSDSEQKSSDESIGIKSDSNINKNV